MKTTYSISILCLGLILFSGLRFSSSMPGEQTDPVTAVVGNNNHSIGSGEETFFLTFIGTSMLWYNFTLFGPVGTNFDLEIWDLNTQTFYARSDRATYPDFIVMGVLTDPIEIRIKSTTGSGNFSLVISETTLPVFIDYMKYSPNLQLGDVYTWQVIYLLNSEPYNDPDGFGHNDEIALEILKNGEDTLIDADNPDYPYFFLLQLNYEFQSLDLSTPSQATIGKTMILPTSFDLDDGRTIGLIQAIQEFNYLSENVTVTELDNTIVVEYFYEDDEGNASVTHTYGKESGILELYKYDGVDHETQANLLFEFVRIEGSTFESTDSGKSETKYNLLFVVPGFIILTFLLSPSKKKRVTTII